MRISVSHRDYPRELIVVNDSNHFTWIITYHISFSNITVVNYLLPEMLFIITENVVFKNKFALKL